MPRHTAARSVARISSSGNRAQGPRRGRANGGTHFVHEKVANVGAADGAQARKKFEGLVLAGRRAEPDRRLDVCVADVANGIRVGKNRAPTSAARCLSSVGRDPCGVNGVSACAGQTQGEWRGRIQGQIHSMFALRKLSRRLRVVRVVVQARGVDSNRV
jgi:hypothetical protein